MTDAQGQSPVAAALDALKASTCAEERTPADVEAAAWGLRDAVAAERRRQAGYLDALDHLAAATLLALSGDSTDDDQQGIRNGLHALRLLAGLDAAEGRPPVAL
ncbi:hypothetical protein [Gordonia sp. SND2]|uniref:hypothetical protein n=1 Tax=Gordonia sp. SND2 TaxID=3388659 RepID=UPI00398BAAFD